jgi:hypothetical protein
MKLGQGLVGIGLMTALAAVGCGSADSTEAGVGGVSARPGGTAGGSPGGSGSLGGTGALGGTAGGRTAGGTTPLGGVGGSFGGGVPGTVVSNQLGGGGGSPAGDNTCQITNVDFLGDTPDMLIVMDRSQSLILDPTNNRWDPARNAVKQITRDWEQLIGFGLEFFPGDGAGNLDPLAITTAILTGGALDLGPACAGMIREDVRIAARNAMPIAQALDRAQPIGFTPTAAALQTALQILGDRNSSLDTRVKPGFVLLVTDGDPMCDLNALADPTGAGDVAQQQAAMQAVMALKAAAIPTYVFGYQIDPLRQGYMNMLAQAGGTNMYYPVENQASIVDAFRMITKDVVRCEFELGMAPPNVTFVRIEIDNKTIPYNTPDGWTLTNGTHVTLQGAACGGLKDGKVHNLNAQIECNPVILN